MSDPVICKTCKREPRSFTTDKGSMAYWFLVPKYSGDPNHLMENGKFNFRVVLEKEAILQSPMNEEYDLRCLCCIGFMMGEPCI